MNRTSLFSALALFALAACAAENPPVAPVAAPTSTVPTATTTEPASSAAAPAASSEAHAQPVVPVMTRTMAPTPVESTERRKCAKDADCKATEKCGALRCYKMQADCMSLVCLPK